jgi:predicted outer membrane protein
MMQVELSQVAAEQTDNPKVRDFAITAIANLGKAGGMLNAMAKEAGSDLPQQPPDDVKKLTDGLAADQGKTLDHEYMAQIVPASTRCGRALR